MRGAVDKILLVKVGRGRSRKWVSVCLSVTVQSFLTVSSDTVGMATVVSDDATFMSNTHINILECCGFETLLLSDSL